LCFVLLGASTAPRRGPQAPLHRFTAILEFDFAGWTAEAVLAKVGQGALSSSAYVAEDARPALVREYFRLIDEAGRMEGEITAAFAQGDQSTDETAATTARLAAVRRGMENLQPLVESILEEQASVILSTAGLARAGPPFPPVSFHLSQLPLALVVSPRDVIRQDALLQLNPGLPLERQAALEGQIEGNLDVSALVVPIGGIGTYPTMIQETGDLSWVAEVVLHEWTHNWLTLRPLGWNYDTSSELRTMNETTAQLVGQTLGLNLLELYYPDLLPAAPSATPQSDSSELGAPIVPLFDFDAEMHATRIRVDELLAQGRVAEAESFMEAQRRMFNAHGYSLRRLNQAYFAFYGAYADVPQGAAGEDPIGAAVRELWAASASPAEFLRTMSHMDSPVDLERAVGRSLTIP
jgi:hypothetical protein